MSKDSVEDAEKTFNEIVRSAVSSVRLSAHAEVSASLSHLNHTAGSGRYAIAQLSKVVERLKDSKAQSKAPALAPISRESRRMKLSSLNKESKET